MTTEELAKILPEFEGPYKEVAERLKKYPELTRIAIGSIRKVLGFGIAKYQKGDVESAAKEYAAGLGSLRSLSKKYKIAPKTLQRKLHKMKVSTAREDYWTTFMERGLEDDVKKGRTLTYVAKRMGLSVSAIAQKAKRMGLQVKK